MAVALDDSFFSTLPELPEVEPREAEMAWLMYSLRLSTETNAYALEKQRTVYTRFVPTLDRITVAKPGPMASFVSLLQGKLSQKLDNPPDLGSLQCSPFDGDS